MDALSFVIDILPQACREVCTANLLGCCEMNCGIKEWKWRARMQSNATVAA